MTINQKSDAKIAFLTVKTDVLHQILRNLRQRRFPEYQVESKNITQKPRAFVDLGDNLANLPKLWPRYPLSGNSDAPLLGLNV